MTLIVNLYGGPGTGKSTTCAGLFFNLKTYGCNCEMAREYAKDKVWEESIKVLEDQPYVFAKQLHKIKRLLGKVDVIITDSPLLLSVHYGKNESEEFKKFVIHENSKLDSVDVFLNRVKKYNLAGRLQTEDEAKKMDIDIRSLLSVCGVGFYTFDAKKDAPNKIFEFLKSNFLPRFLNHGEK